MEELTIFQKVLVFIIGSGLVCFIIYLPFMLTRNVGKDKYKRQDKSKPDNDIGIDDEVPMFRDLWD